MDLTATSDGTWKARFDVGDTDEIVNAALIFLLPGFVSSLLALGALFKSTDMELTYLRAWATFIARDRRAVLLGAVILFFSVPFILTILFGVQVGKEIGAGLGIQLALLSLFTFLIVPFCILTYLRRSGRITATLKWAGFSGAVVMFAFQVTQMTTDETVRDGDSKFRAISTIFLTWALIPIIGSIFLATNEASERRTHEQQQERDDSSNTTPASKELSAKKTFLRAFGIACIILAGYSLAVFLTSPKTSRFLGVVTAAAIVTLDLLILYMTIASIDADGDWNVTAAELRSRNYDPGALSLVFIVTRIGAVIGGMNHVNSPRW